MGPRPWQGWRFLALLGTVILLLHLVPRSVAAQLLVCAATTTPVTFGTYNPGSGSPTDAVGNVQVTCGGISVPVAYQIRLSAGNSGSYSARHLTSGVTHLSYNLYTDAARTQVWGDGSSSTSFVSDSYTLLLVPATRNYAVYGRIVPLQNVPAGAYGDSITVIVDY